MEKNERNCIYSKTHLNHSTVDMVTWPLSYIYDTNLLICIYYVSDQSLNIYISQITTLVHGPKCRLEFDGGEAEISATNNLQRDAVRFFRSGI